MSLPVVFGREESHLVHDILKERSKFVNWKCDKVNEGIVGGMYI